MNCLAIIFYLRLYRLLNYSLPFLAAQKKTAREVAAEATEETKYNDYWETTGHYVVDASDFAEATPDRPTGKPTYAKASSFVTLCRTGRRVNLTITVQK